MTDNSEYISEPRVRDLPINIRTIPRWLMLSLIRFYQAIISPALPANTCRFYPSCSHYSYQAIYRFGVLKGSLMGILRLLRCNPFNPGGYDPVPTYYSLLQNPGQQNKIPQGKSI